MPPVLYCLISVQPLTLWITLFCSIIFTLTLVFQSTPIPGLKLTCTTGPFLSRSMVQLPINLEQSMLYLKDLALDLSCLSSIPASCFRSLSAIYLMYTHTPTTHNCTSPLMPTLMMTGRCSGHGKLRCGHKGMQLAMVNIDSLTVGNYTIIISPSSEVENLGCWLDNQLKMDKHINKICQTTFYHLQCI